ncbi:hypothetical protein [Streptomyces lavenduligriseus]|uniref:hypothetical protein n=1 Tax=Streptomyces lavenduligriseus TaxID=67315 RepID=UPI000A774B0A|nr:hypothetical protein [Streptomyces lavenduligriseus]
MTRRTNEASGEDGGGPYGKLVLVRQAAHDIDQPSARVLVQVLREVDQPAPYLRLFQGDDPSQSPEQRLPGSLR